MPNRRLLVALAFVAAALSGCATSLATSDTAPSDEGFASPATTTSAPAPSNVFRPEANHWFGSGGP
jgi:hypothetical protein